MKREQVGQPTRPCLPITLKILLKIHQQWRQRDTEWDIVTICLCFYGFLRVGEAVAPSDTGFDPSQHLAFDDIVVDSIDNPSFMRVRIKHSKTDPFRIGVNIIIGCTGGPLCPVAAVLAYLAVRKGEKFPCLGSTIVMP